MIQWRVLVSWDLINSNTNEGQVCRQTQIWVQVESGIKYCLIETQAAGIAYELFFSPSVNTTKI